MSTFLTGNGRTFKSLNIDIIKSPSTSWASNSSSPSSTLSESNNSPLKISTRKPRTPRKRPNQTYNEAAAILSTAYPKIFPKKNHSKFKILHENISPQLFEPSDVFIPFQVIDNSSYLLHSPVMQSPTFPVSTNKFEKQCLSPGEITSQGNLSEICDEDEYLREIEFDAESILVEGIGQGIDSIMGNSSIENEVIDNNVTLFTPTETSSFCYGYPVGMGFDFGYGMRKEFVANGNVNDGNWYKSPIVNVADITPKMPKMPAEKKTKKVEVMKLKLESVVSKEKLISEANEGLMLKLDYDNILNAWSEKSSPFSGAEAVGNDVQARLAQIDLFSENGGLREASVQRYKEKRRTRLFAKKIRYEVRKVNADRRPRMKGRFVRTPNSPDVEQE